MKAVPFLSAPSKLPCFKGLTQEKISRCIENGVMKNHWSLFVKAFTEKWDSDGLFCGEFWGKWFTSAALAYQYQPSEEYLQILRSAVQRILETQEPSGRISASATDFTVWDLWGRKYILLGLLAYYDITQDRQVLSAAVNMLDNLIDTLEKEGKKITEIGLTVLQGISSCSLLQPVALLYERTGKKRFLDFALDMIDLWEKPSAYNSKGLRLLSDTLLGKVPVEIASPKGYETMSCMEGLCEMYRITGDEQYLRVVKTYMEAVLEHEVMLVGSGSSGELWCEGRYRQTQILESPMETCVTATYMKLCHQLLRVTGEAKWANELEVSLYNALYGAMRNDGAWWAYFSPMQGQRIPSPIQLEQVQSSCCVVNGPRALMEVPQWAVMCAENGVVVNLYEPARYAFLWHNQPVAFEVEGTYPQDGEIMLRFSEVPEEPFAVMLRMPAWEKNFALYDGENCFIPFEVEKGYAVICKKWTSDDCIRLCLDMAPRIVDAPGNPVYKALMAGPIVLGMDERYVPISAESLWLKNDAVKKQHDPQMNIDYYVQQSVRQESVAPVCTKTEVLGAMCAWNVQFIKRPIHFFSHEEKQIIFLDYASCGSLTRNIPLRVWFTLPLYLPDIFPQNTKWVIGGKGQQFGDEEKHEKNTADKEN